jgi:hypothetical protein
MATLLINTTNTDTTSITSKDVNAPYSFQDWKIRNNTVPANQAFTLYEKYLKDWYVKKDLTNVVTINYVTDYYKAFLKTLGFSPRTAQESQLFNNVDIDDPLSLQSVIAGYARKLKDVSVYISTRRNTVAYSKLKANLIGTNTSLERLFYSYILNAFTRKVTPDGIITTSFTITSPDILTSLPFLSVISDSFNIQVEEIYDTANYFDRDPSVDISTYTAIASGIPAALYSAGSYSIPEEYLIISTIEAVATTNSISMTTTLPTYWTFIGDDFTTTYQLSNLTSARASDYQVSIEGVMQVPDTGYTISTVNQNIVFSEPPPINSIIVIVKRY